MMYGYKEAEIIDTQISELMNKFDIRDHPKEYLRFARTVKTTCELIEMEAMKVLMGATSR